MTEHAGHMFSSMGALFALPVEEGSSLVRLIVLAAIFVLPPIFKAIKESQRKRKELEQRGVGLPAPPEDPAPPPAAAPEYEASTQDVAPGREAWEQLMRADRPAPAPVVPPPIPSMSSPTQGQRRRVLTEARALTEEPALTEAPPLTDARPRETAIPELSYENLPSYDEQTTQKSPLGREFAEFAPQEGLASDREGGPAKRIGSRESFPGVEQFQGLGSAAVATEVTQKEIGAGPSSESVSRARRVAPRGFDRNRLRQAVIAAEVLGPPLALRALETGPSRPLGWS